MWNPIFGEYNPYRRNPTATFGFVINNYSKISTNTIIPSPTFLCGGCEWYVNAYVYPQGGVCADSHLSVSLNVANPNLLQSGWKRSADFYFILSNLPNTVIYRTPVAQPRYSFNAMTPSWYVLETLPVSKLKADVGFWDIDTLFIEVFITNVEAVDGDVSDKKETVEINGFQVLTTQATQVWKLFAEHPDIAEDFKPKNQMVKTTYMNVLLNLIETLDKPSKNHSETEVANGHSELCELIEVGFKLDWLKTKFDEFAFERKKTNDTDWVQQLEERLKNLEVMELRKVKPKLEEVLLALKKAEDADESRGQQLEERINNRVRMELRKVKAKLEWLSLEMKKAEDANERLKNLEGMELGFKLESLKTKLDKVTLEMNKSDDDDDEEDDESWDEQIEERVKNLELNVSGFKVEHLKTELDEVSLERKKENSRAEQLEKRLKNLLLENRA